MYLYIGMILLLCVLLFVLSLLFRKAKAEKICKMSCPQKLQIIENLVFPFGYTYIPKGDFFSSSLEAWQRRFGYAALYDKSASHFHMVFNALPVYLTMTAAPGSSSSGKVSTDFTPAAKSASIVLTAF